jgi:hypothetical protein
LQKACWRSSTRFRIIKAAVEGGIEPLAFDGGGVHGILQQSIHLGLQTFLTGNTLNAAQQSTL